MNDALANSPELDEVVRRLRGFILQRVRSEADADDTLQDVLLRLIKSGARGDVENVPAWLFTVARHAIIDRHRRQRTQRLHRPQGGGVTSEAAEHEPAAPDSVASASGELARCMEPLLGRLDPEDRALLERVELSGASQRSIASELGIPSSTLKSRVQRARTKLLDEFTRCCAIERDTRGLPIDFRRNGDADDDCGAGGGCG